MKIKVIISAVCVFVLILVVSVCVIYYSAKPTSYVIDGTNYSASVVNGNSMTLTLNNDGGEWSIADHAVRFSTEYGIAGSETTTFRIIALYSGSDHMRFRYRSKNGSSQTYQLSLKISRHKGFVQIDDVNFFNITAIKMPET